MRPFKKQQQCNNSNSDFSYINICNSKSFDCSE